MIVQKTDNVFQVTAILKNIVVISFLTQLIIDFSIVNLMANLICLLSSLLCIKYCFFKANIFKYPLSVLMTFGIGLSYFILPPLLTSLEFRPVINNLLYPINTLLHASIFMCIIIVTHFFYKNSKIAFVLSNKIKILYKKANIYNSLEKKRIYFMGFIGLLAKSYALLFNNYLQTSSDPVVKFMEGVSSFSFLPFIVLLPHLFKFENKKYQGKNIVFFLIYTLILFAIGFAMNSRTFLFKGFVSVLLVAFFLFLYGYFKTKIRLKHILYAICLAAISNYLISKISLSLLGIRDIRNNISTIDLVYKTIESISDSNLKKNSKSILTEKQEWDENYIENSLFSRLCNLKLADNIISIIPKMKEAEIILILNKN